MNRKEIFQKEINTGATITEVKIYTNSLKLIFAANDQCYYINSRGEKVASLYEKPFLSMEESNSLEAEIKDLKKKIRIFEKSFKKSDF